MGAGASTAGEAGAAAAMKNNRVNKQTTDIVIDAADSHPQSPTCDATVKENKEATHDAKHVKKVAKRPARGYHMFRNGLLNVKPKGEEKKITEANQSSLLLGLPPEIRNMIWEYTLGGKTFRPKRLDRKNRLRQHSQAPQHGAALLRTCRQIYAETALMPVALSTFSVDLGERLGYPAINQTLKSYQRSHITSITCEMSCFDPAFDLSVVVDFEIQQLQYSLLPKLPELRKIRFLVFIPPPRTLPNPSYPAANDPEATATYTNEAKRAIKSRLGPSKLEVDVQIVFMARSTHNAMFWSGQKLSVYE